VSRPGSSGRWTGSAPASGPDPAVADVRAGRVSIDLDRDEATVFGRQLVDAIRRGWTSRGAAPPRLLLDVADRVNALARASTGTGTPRDAGQAPGTGTKAANLASAQPVLTQPVMTVSEAAEAAGISTGYLRRVIRRGEIRVSQDHRGRGYAVVTDSLGAWLGQRRRNERKRKAA
jgi:excisionase family DNA binding protein